tara:strand:- start:242 stop:382 length:141 start_codon:yes stop_codon:yes gene_type:complete
MFSLPENYYYDDPLQLVNRIVIQRSPLQDCAQEEEKHIFTTKATFL